MSQPFEVLLQGCRAVPSSVCLVKGKVQARCVVMYGMDGMSAMLWLAVLCTDKPHVTRSGLMAMMMNNAGKRWR